MSGGSVLDMGYAGQYVTVSIDPEAERQAAPALAFVRPHFTLAPGDGRVPAALSIEVLPLARWREPAEPGESTRVRTARTHNRHIYATRWQAAGRTTIAVPTSRTAFDLADDGSQARVYVSDTSRYHLSDLLRDVMWELAAASGAGHFVHAAAVSDGGSAVAITGPKGSGKTTTVLDFIHAGARCFTGDALFAAVDGSVVHSFPDYPGVCWGTLRTFPRLLAAAVGLGHAPAVDDGKKVLLPHDLYLTALAAPNVPPPLPLSAVVVANVKAPGEARLVRMDPDPALLEPKHRHTSAPGEGWEPFLTAVARRSARGAGDLAAVKTWPDVPWYARLGRGRLRPEEIEQVVGGVRPAV